MWVAGAHGGADVARDQPRRLARPTLHRSLVAIRPYYVVRFFGGMLVLAGMVVMAWNLWHTAAEAARAPDRADPRADPGARSAPAAGAAAGRRQGRATMGLRYKHFEAIEKHAGLLARADRGHGVVRRAGGDHAAVRQGARGRAGAGRQALRRVAPGRQGRLRARGLLPVPLADDPRAALRDPALRRISVAGESVYDRPFQWGSKRTGPDLARVGGKYSDEWHRMHMRDPRGVVPESNMPGYPWLPARRSTRDDVAARMRTLRALGDPYSDAEIAAAPQAVGGKTELDAAHRLSAGARRASTRRPPPRRGRHEPRLGGCHRCRHRGDDGHVHRHLVLGVAAAPQARVRALAKLPLDDLEGKRGGRR